MRTISRITLCLICVCAVFLMVAPSVWSSTRQQRPDRPPMFKVMSATLTAVPPDYVGPCPGEIKFRGYIVANGRGTVRYTFLRSDGATAPVATLFFEQAGRREVETTWTLGGPRLPNYNGWEAIKILSPNQMVSDRAVFHLTCRDSGPQFKVIRATLTANPAHYQGRCPGLIRFNGIISANGAGLVRYTFLRSDGARAPVYTLMFRNPGTKPVSTTWTLGGPQVPTYRGWEELKILAPNEMVSDRAYFDLSCRR